VKGLRVRLTTVAAAVLLVNLAIVVLLRFVPPPTTMFMLTAPQRPVHYDWVDWSHIAPAAALAVVAAEDQKFPYHWGFDFAAIDRALHHNEHSRRLRGGSTISQQTAKNLFLWRSRSYLRKGLEAGFTVLLELSWSKRRILETYLNVAQFGPDVYGVEAAARHYFGKPASRLTPHEAALLAAVLPNPVHYRLAPPSGYVLARASEIEEQMRQLGSGYLRDLR
jgi:monofunctional biosynthetic peptidoglycan transglycosylase